MVNMQDRTVVDFSGNTKQAALFFDHVIPVSWWYNLWESEVDSESGCIWDLQGIARKLFPPELDGHTLNAALVISSDAAALSWPDFLSMVEKKYLERIGFQAAPRFLPEPSRIKRYAKKLNQSRSRLFSLGNLVFKHTPPEIPVPQFHESLAETPTASSCTFLTLPSLALIDTEKASWRHIFEFRMDEHARLKLRRLRLFMESVYSGKSKEFIEDDLCMRLQDYENATKEWGFETTMSSLELVLSSKSFMGAAAASASALVLGHPSLATFAAASGATVELGRISLHVAKRAYDLSKMRRDHPLGYIITANRSLTRDER
jgi:hypothetical protein